MEVKKYGLSGIGDNVELSKGGSRIKENAGVIEARNAADADYVIVRGADPVNDNDLVTKKYLENRASIYVTAQIDGSIPTAAMAAGTFALVTTAGNGYLLKEVYRSDGSNWVLVNTPEGIVISVTDDLIGGTDTYFGDHTYMRDADGSTWVDLWPAQAITKVMKSERASLVFNTASPLNIGSQLPSNAIVTKIIVNVTTTFDGTTESTIEFGDSGNTARLGATSDVNLAVAGTYEISCYHEYVAATQVIGTYTQDSATQGAAEIIMEYSIQ